MKAENHYALIIGVAAYQYINPLSAAVARDANAMHDLLIDPAYCAYPAENVRVLQDSDATCQAIHTTLDWLATVTDSQSVVSIFFSGHGGQAGVLGQEVSYLLPVDAKFTAESGEWSNALTSADFTDCLRNIAARKLLVVFDCCHAGGIGQPKSTKDMSVPLKQGLTTLDYQRLAAGQGRAIVASSANEETSLILPFEDNSLFTKHILAGLRGGIPSYDGLIRVFDLFRYVRENVQQEAQANGYQQTPFFQCALHDDFPVAFYQGGKKEVYPPSVLLSDASISTEGQIYDFDVYISCMTEPNDNDDVMWLIDELVPQLKRADIKIAWMLDDQDPLSLGTTLLDSDATGMSRARRTLVVMSKQSAENYAAKVESTMAQHMGIDEGLWRVIPVYRERKEEMKVPVRLGMLSSVHLASRLAEREMKRLIAALKQPPPKI